MTKQAQPKEKDREFRPVRKMYEDSLGGRRVVLYLTPRQAVAYGFAPKTN